MTEQFANNAATTLSAAVETTDGTSISVTSATGFPAEGNFRILVDDEIMLVTAVDGTAWAVTRGAESTTGATHLSGAAVTHVLTAGALGALKDDAITEGAFIGLSDTPSSYTGMAGKVAYVKATEDGLEFL